MKVFESITSDNFLLYAAKHYDNPQCTSVEEFHEDLHRFKYIKRLLGRYDKNNDLAERLILNHLVVLYNVFGIEPAHNMLMYKIDADYLSYIKPFLVFLNYLPEDKMIEIPLDQHIVDKLRAL